MNKHLLPSIPAAFLYLIFLVATVLIGGCSGGSGSGVTSIIESVGPEDASSNVSVKAAPSVTFSRAMDTTSAESAFSITPKVSGALSWNDDHTVLTFTPSKDLDVAAQQYTCTVGAGAQDEAGNALSSPYQWQWATWSAAMNELIADYDYGYSTTTDPSGNVYLTGMFDGSKDFGAHFGVVDRKTALGDPDVFVTKINADGTYGWTKRIGGAGSDAADFITSDPSGNVYLTVAFDGTIDFGADFGTPDVMTSSDSSDIFVVKINTDGTYAWTKKNYDLDNQLGGGLLRGGNTVRHIYNNSTKPIIMYAFNPIFGNVYFLNCPSGTVKNGPCTIPPKSSLAWEFTTTWGQARGWVTSDLTAKDCYACSVKNDYKEAWGRFGGFDKGYQTLPGVQVQYNSPAKLDVKFSDR